MSKNINVPEKNSYSKTKKISIIILNFTRTYLHFNDISDHAPSLKLCIQEIYLHTYLTLNWQHY